MKYLDVPGSVSRYRFHYIDFSADGCQYLTVLRVAYLYVFTSGRTGPPPALEDEDYANKNNDLIYMPGPVLGATDKIRMIKSPLQGGQSVGRQTPD